jgi:hypothetical protein
MPNRGNDHISSADDLQQCHDAPRAPKRNDQLAQKWALSGLAAQALDAIRAGIATLKTSPFTIGA